MAIKYDEIIEAKKKEVGRLQKQIVEIGPQLADKIKEGNKVIYANKEQAEKIIVDANAKAEEIVSTVSRLRAEAEEIKKGSVVRSKELDEKEKAHLEACRVTKKEVEKLAQDKIDFGKLQKEKLAEIEATIAKVRELMDAVSSLGKSVNAKIAEIVKIQE